MFVLRLEGWPTKHDSKGDTENRVRRDVKQQ